MRFVIHYTDKRGRTVARESIVAKDAPEAMLVMSMSLMARHADKGYVLGAYLVPVEAKDIIDDDGEFEYEIKDSSNDA